MCARGGVNQLLLSYTKPFRAVSRYTVSRWIKCTTGEAGVELIYVHDIVQEQLQHQQPPKIMHLLMKYLIPQACVLRATVWAFRISLSVIKFILKKKKKKYPLVPAVIQQNYRQTQLTDVSRLNATIFLCNYYIVTNSVSTHKIYYSTLHDKSFLYFCLIST